MIFISADILPYTVLIGLSIPITLSLFFTFYTYKDLESFFLFLTIFISFFIANGFIPLWVLILLLIFDMVILYFRILKR